MVAGVQTFSQLIHFHPHIHAIATDGAFTPDGDFLCMPQIDKQPLLASGLRYQVFALCIHCDIINVVNIIATRTVREYQDEYPDAATALDAWLEVAGKAHWESFNEVLETYTSVDQVGSCLVFNIRGNNYRLICGVVYANQWVKGTLFVKHFLTHAEYDKDTWKRDCER